MSKKAALRKATPGKPPLLSQMIFDLLRERVISGQLAPGERLNEIVLQQELDTSRSPIREAIRRLELEGLVEIRPRRGAFVRQLSAEDMREAVEVRAQLEALAAALAAERRTTAQLGRMESLLEEMDESLASKDIERYTQAHHRFHQCLAEASGNQTLERHLRLVAQPFTTLRLTYIYLVRQGPHSEANHRCLLEALSSKDSERAGELANQHVLALLELEPEVSQEP